MVGLEVEVGSVIELAAELIRHRSDGRAESVLCDVLASRLAGAGFSVRRSSLSEGRENLEASLPDGPGPPLMLTGHLDTVPATDAPWRLDPFAGDVEDGYLHGRGSVDMKGGVAALVVASERFARGSRGASGLKLVFTAGEESGCLGAAAHVGTAPMSRASALLVAEPTGCEAVLAHQGVVWLRVAARGVAAHASRPDLGGNAAWTLIGALAGLGELDLGPPHALTGSPTWSIGTISGGVQTNIVPDEAQATVDVRVAPGSDPDDAVQLVTDRLGDGVAVEVLRSLPGVATSPDDPFAELVAATCRRHGGTGERSAAMYFTDASVLHPAVGSPPVVVCGPGDPELAHAKDERCSVDELRRAVAIYEDVIASWT